VYQIDESMKDKFPKKTTSNEITDELDYCHQLISVVEKEPKIAEIPAVKEKLNVLKEVTEDFKENFSYSNDPDASTGHKSEDSSFFGFKSDLAMSDERIIKAAVVTTGEKSDGRFLQELIHKSKEAGIEIDTIIGDTAYSEKDNLSYTKENGLALVSRLHSIVTNGTHTKENEFEFNKDAGMYVCKAGHMAIGKKYDSGKGQK
jgi:hypothetical protein